MRISWILALATLSVVGIAWGAEMVTAPGSSTQYPRKVETSVGGGTAQMSLTGTAMRTRLVVNVYAIASYLQQGVRVESAEELARRDCAKRLHLVMERTVDGKTMADAFETAIRQNYPAPTFTKEVNLLTHYMRNMSIRKGEHIYLTHIPGIGLHCSVEGKADLVIKNVRFSQAVWEIYLGKNNLGEGIKRALTSLL